MKTLLRMTDEEARAFLERVRWPDGKPVCPHCGVVGEATRLVQKPGAKMRAGVWKCRVKGCRKQFTVTVGTIFEASHIGLGTWMAAFFILCSAKKSISALQLQRQLGLGSYKTAWFLAHRIRYAMASGPLGELLKGAIEADETYVGGKPRKAARRSPGSLPYSPEAIARSKKRGRGTDKQPVALVLARGGGARAKLIRKPEGKFLKKFIRENVDRTSSTLYTDELNAYVTIGKGFSGGHESVNHGKMEYARPGGIHSNTAESFFSLFKRGFHGSFHHLSVGHLQRYLDEFAFRWSHRFENDAARTVRAIVQGDGVRLMYRAPKGFRPA